MDFPFKGVADTPAEVSLSAEDADASNILFYFRDDPRDVAAPINVIADAIKRQAAADVSSALIKTVEKKLQLQKLQFVSVRGREDKVAQMTNQHPCAALSAGG